MLDFRKNFRAFDLAGAQLATLLLSRVVSRPSEPVAKLAASAA
jgi:hypothetical protein